MENTNKWEGSMPKHHEQQKAFKPSHPHDTCTKMTEDTMAVINLGRAEREEFRKTKSAVEIETVENASKLLKTPQLHLAVIHDYMTEDFLQDAMASMGCPVSV